MKSLSLSIGIISFGSVSIDREPPDFLHQSHANEHLALKRPFSVQGRDQIEAAFKETLLPIGLVSLSTLLYCPQSLGMQTLHPLHEGLSISCINYTMKYRWREGIKVIKYHKYSYILHWLYNAEFIHQTLNLNSWIIFWFYVTNQLFNILAKLSKKTFVSLSL